MSLGKTRSQTKAANALEAAGGRADSRTKRKADEASLDDGVRSKKRRGQYVSPDDVRFLEMAKTQMEALDLPPDSVRAKTVDIVKEYFERLRPLEQKDTQTGRPAAHLLTGEEARRLLSSSECVRAPVFVSDCRLPATLEERSCQRPIEQLFEWLENDDDQHEAANVEATEEEMESHTIKNIKTALRQHNGYVQSPNNFPDIPSNLPGTQIPEWLATPTCNFLNNLISVIMDNSIEDTIKAQMVDEAGEPLHIENDDGKPIPDQEELAEISMAWRHWQTTIMLAEAGAITLPHWDRYGLATWIHCIEGEIGFAWLDNPTKQEHTAWMRQEIRGSWLFKVLRPGDALYMPAGTVHFVFRLPHGRQTAGLAGHLVRRCEIDDWLRVLATELEYEVDEPSDVPYLSVVPQMMLTMVYLHGNAKSEEDSKKYGGRKRYQAIRKQLGTLMRLLAKLNEQGWISS